MKNFEFSHYTDQFDDKTKSDDQVESHSNFFDFIEENSHGNKGVKKAKKAIKHTHKNKKKIKKMAACQKQVEVEVSKLRSEVATLKKFAYDSKLSEIVDCNDVAERRKLAYELKRMEV